MINTHLYYYFSGVKSSKMSFNLPKPIHFLLTIMIDYSWQRFCANRKSVCLTALIGRPAQVQGAQCRIVNNDHRCTQLRNVAVYKQLQTPRSSVGRTIKADACHELKAPGTLSRVKQVKQMLWNLQKKALL